MITIKENQTENRGRFVAFSQERELTHTVDGRNPAPPMISFPANTEKSYGFNHGFMQISQPSTVWVTPFFGGDATKWWFSHWFPLTSTQKAILQATHSPRRPLFGGQDYPYYSEPCWPVLCPAFSLGINVISGCSCMEGYVGSIQPSEAR